MLGELRVQGTARTEHRCADVKQGEAEDYDGVVNACLCDAVAGRDARHGDKRALATINILGGRMLLCCGKGRDQSTCR